MNDPGAPRNNKTVQHHYRPNKIRIVSRCIIWLRWRRPEVRSGGCPGAPDAPKTCRCRESADAPPPDGLCARTARTLPHLITSLCSSPRSVSVCYVERRYFISKKVSLVRTLGGVFKVPPTDFPKSKFFCGGFCIFFQTLVWIKIFSSFDIRFFFYQNETPNSFFLIFFLYCVSQNNLIDKSSLLI